MKLQSEFNFSDNSYREQIGVTGIAVGITTTKGDASIAHDIYVF
jgi:hypothetical protein